HRGYRRSALQDLPDLREGTRLISPERPVTALVLAGSRGPTDPVASHAGLPHKALVPVAGVPMLLRVVRALRAAPSVGRIVLCIEPAVLEADPAVAAELRGDDLHLVPTDSTPGRSVLRALKEIAEPFPLLATTADHPLLTPAMIEHFCAAAPADADIAVGLATAATIGVCYPETRRTYYRFAGERYSGCNLFLLRTPAAAKAASFWSEVERHRKQPWRLVLAIGPVTLGRFLLGLLSLEAALERLSRLIGARIGAVELPFAEAAIDVDRPSDLALAEKILTQRL
ncbi:MAG: NTP transferase domain-containing protein, partial [Dongiaceae bacterium]